jgi:hypothetical protein
MSHFNLNNNHQLISNSNQYFLEKKFVSIHSEDRDCLKYVNSSEFEIELPQDYLNVQSVKLSTWSFPSNYSVFSTDSNNVFMTFKFITLYNPGEHSYSDPLTEAIFAGLYSYLNGEFIIVIEQGFYNPIQMATELTNKFNEVITVYLKEFFVDPNFPEYNYAAALFNKYDRFTVVYNEVSQKLWFGNNADQFVLTNKSGSIFKKEIQYQKCIPGRRSELPNFSDFGLPSFLGFNRIDATAYSAEEYKEDNINDINISILTSTSGDVPRFYFVGDLSTETDYSTGYWLLPVLPGATVYYLQAPLKINFMGPAYIYMEIEGLNCIDETSPYNLSTFTAHTNQTNGVVNSAFAKIPIISTPISQWFDSGMIPYKYFNPPAERIRKLKIKIRYHNNVLVDFGSFDYSFMLEFNLLKPQNERKYNITDASMLIKLNP